MPQLVRGKFPTYRMHLILFCAGLSPALKGINTLRR